MGRFQLSQMIGSLAFNSFPFTYVFHHCERCQRFHPMMNKIIHHILSGGNNFFYFHRIILDEIPGIIRPYAGTIAEAGHFYQFREVLWLYIFQYSSCKRCSIPRQSQCPYGNFPIYNNICQF